MKTKTFANLHRLLAAAGVACCLGANAQILNTRLVSQLTLGADSETADVWTEGSHVYVARNSLGLDIINASNPANPVKVANILPFAHAHMEDVQVVNGIAYVGNHVPNLSPRPWVGLFMYDVSNPASPVEVGRIEWGAGAWYHLGGNVHNIFIDRTPLRTVAYLSSVTSSALEVFDVTVPAAPVWLSTIHPPLTVWGTIPGRSHESCVINGRCYATWLNGGFTIHDVSNPAAPVLLAHQQYAGAFTYHAWPTADGQFLCTTDGRRGAGLAIWNISNLANITQVGGYVSPTGAIIHNAFVKGKYVYISHFEDGLRVLDISNPSSPRSVGWYDPDPGPAVGAYSGAWGVFPFQNKIQMTHSTGGLYILDFVDTVTITSANWYRRINQLVVEATSTAAPSTTLTVQGFGPMTYNSGTGIYTLTRNGVSNPGNVTVTSDLGASASSSVRKR